MNIHIIIHEQCENPAAIIDWATKNNHTLTYSRVYQYDSLPENCHGFDFLIIMGGPQNTSTTLVECPYFDAKAEIALIKKAVASKKLVLGVCLGAQLLSEAFDAVCIKSPQKELGIFDVKLTPAANHDPIFANFPSSFPVAHWHDYMPGISDEAVVLAESAGCPRQIIRYAPGVYGFQCHFEFTQTLIADMLEQGAEEVDINQHLPYVQTQAQLRLYNYTPMNELLCEFLDQLVLLANAEKNLGRKQSNFSLV